MFYSQFILAKKGPLGTIWIAAHLERKLRKNQVADTDIGVSVDSILFPDVPIALRLSSHLLLGVVRIYSRKVNYLFDDCSEALLKIKQAFRSTAVDLPPEESTAPYHSITLPETFDLDDFELPDNEIFQGNYTDHHVSSREQITLQDTMDGVVYSTSQFGLDERFGDGDASQIGLDLDEDLFLGKLSAQGNDADADRHASIQPMTPLEEDETIEGVSGTSATMQLNGVGIQKEVLAANKEALELAQSSPGLEEEPNQPTVQGALAHDDRLESKDHSLTNSVAVECTENVISKSDPHHENDNAEWSLEKNLNYETVVGMHSEENGYLLGDMKIKEADPQGHSLPPVVTTENISADNGLSTSYQMAEGCVESPGVRLEETVASPSCSQVTTELEDPGRRTCSIDVKYALTVKLQKIMVNHALLQTNWRRPEVVNVEARACQEPNGTETVNPLTHDDMISNGMPVLRACNFQGQNDISPLGGEDRHTTDVMKPVSEKIQISESALCGETPDDCRKLDEEMENAASCGNPLEKLDRSATLELPAPEKLLAVSEGLTSKPHDMLVESTPDIEGLEEGNVADAGTKIILKRTAESIPDDDDLLSSILVGRKSSVLKLKPTPPAPEIVSTKRLRAAPRASASKRKVLMDDMMVLHGDLIRQQLTNTEDIRRVRKKAPCTRPEILIIQRQFLEEEIFCEPIYTGMSAALMCLHSETFDLSRTKVCENDQDDASLEVVKDVESSVVVRNDTEAQPADISIQTESQHAEDHKSEQETLGGIAEVEIEGENVDVADAANQSVDGYESSFPSGPVSGDVCNMPAEVVVQSSLVDKSDDVDASFQMDASCISPRKLESQSVEENASMMGIYSGKGVDGVEYVENNAEVRVDPETDFSEHTNTIDASLTVASVETGECDNTISVNGVQPVEGVVNNSLSLMNENEVLGSDLGYDDKDLISSCMQGEGVKADSAFSLELDVDLKNPTSNDGENAGCQEADPQNAMDAEITADHSVVEDRYDFEDVAIGNDTEFLSVDDDEVAEDDDDNLPAEDARLLENSGWSSEPVPRLRRDGWYRAKAIEVAIGQACRGSQINNDSIPTTNNLGELRAYLAVGKFGGVH
ncbi:hypothetical protein FNV43_RR05633 [Rhamnella rubrinervis]|uniref:Rad21/Rec8-like protein N-terminal domain-containing protein n=1 Tax=Rhamnella rubrinervis TaxID=2594499 RepID=A0A8K0HMH8_9ROSA|nr:hypothetical protein FNV43_RR05633 [Rhamnella rubrinervis]